MVSVPPIAGVVTHASVNAALSQRRAASVIPPSFRRSYGCSGTGVCIGKRHPRGLSFETIRLGCCRWRRRVRFKPSHHLWAHWEKTISIFGKIMSAIFGTKAGAATVAGGTAASTGSASGSTAGSSTAAAAPAQTVDVAPILDKAVAARAKSWNGAPRSSI